MYIVQSHCGLRSSYLKHAVLFSGESHSQARQALYILTTVELYAMHVCVHAFMCVVGGGGGRESERGERGLGREGGDGDSLHHGLQQFTSCTP